MPKLKWDQVGERLYQTGVDHGVLYPQANGVYPKGVAWNGLVNVTESPSGAEDSPLYADNMKYLNLKSAEELGLTVECYTYPDEWGACNGETNIADGVRLGQQRRNTFGLSYRTKLGNDTEGEDYGYLLHLVYGCSASPSEQAHGTINDSPEAVTFSYSITTNPIPISGVGEDGKPFKPVASIIIDSTKVPREKMEMIEAILYGSDAAGAAEGEEGDGGDTPTDPTPTTGVARLPMPNEIKELFSEG